MCCNGKCCGFINVETGSMIFAVINAVSSLLTVIGSLIGIVVFYFVNNSYRYQAGIGNFDVKANNFNDVSMDLGGYHISSQPHYKTESYIVYITCGTLLGVGLLNFLFAVILCNGVNKRNPGQIKTYFIYGIVMAVLSSIVVLIFGILTCGILLILSIPIVIYGFILHMIRMTMDKFTSGEIYDFHHRRLTDTTLMIKP